MKNSIRLAFGLFIIAIVFGCFNTYAQKIIIPHIKNTSFDITEKANNSLQFKAEIGVLDFKKKLTSLGYFNQIFIEGYLADNQVGIPALPVLRKLIDVPVGASVEINILSISEEEFSLPDNQITFPIFPAQLPVSKSSSTDDIEFKYESVAYSKNAYLERDIVSLNPLGTMRSYNLSMLEFRPVAYNPAAKKIKIVTHIVFELKFNNADMLATKELKENTASPYFQVIEKSIIASNSEKSNLTQYPVKYVIVSDPIFQQVLQPFIAWKTMKGFTVIEAYTNDPLVGTTTTSIKSYLQNLYDSATPSDPAFSFVLFVGDVGQVPSFNGTTGSHNTDLYYCEYTGDMLPEVYYGRFSANNLNELQPQIDKTLEYEKYLMSNPSFLNEAVLVSGVDASMAPIHGNGHINYITDIYINSSTGFSPHVYLYPASGSSGPQIIQNISDGAGFANYTAHCSSAGWADPSFSTSHINGLNNGGKYSFMIGNCCSSNDFSVYACFGEAILRAADKGAIGYIGGSNSTYWDEDYWWGVGFKSVILNPVYNATQLGALDRMFHTNAEPFSEWFVTQGQINIAGNLAVQQSASSLANYYWEIYHLMGDPSLMPYFKVPPVLNITYNSVIPVGISNFTITTEPYTYVALSKNGVLHGAGLTDSTGIINLNIIPFLVPGQVDIVATKQNRQPHISTINAIAPNGPYVVYNSHQINDSNGNNNGLPDYGESITLNVKLCNVGNQTANAVNAKLKSTNPYVGITDSLQTYGNIAAGDTVLQNNAFALTINNLIPDQEIVPFTLEIKDVNDSIWISQFSITLNAPVFKIEPFVLDDLLNSNGILDAGEQALLSVPTQNIGHATAQNTQATLQSLSTYIVVNTGAVNLGNLIQGQTLDADFTITSDTATPSGTPCKLLYTVTATPYQKTDTLTIIVGEIPVITMKDTVVTTCMAYFYDSGGQNNMYDDNENSTITFYPTNTEDIIKVTFTFFDVEENTYANDCWDELIVYDGTGVTAPLIGTYCGTNIPGPFVANNANGALTFVFSSDYSVSHGGWEAEVSCLSPVEISDATKEKFNFNIYPNPTSGLINIELKGQNDDSINLNIMTAQGKTIISKRINLLSGNYLNIDMSNYAKGLYIIQIDNSEIIQTKKIILY